MVKSASLHSDIDFIKEFEELKLKQKLLVESLRTKKKSQNQKELSELGSKLDFLVEIFKEANDTDENEQKIEEHLKLILDKLDTLETKYDDVLDKLDKIGESSNENLSNSDDLLVSLDETTTSEDVLNSDNSELKTGSVIPEEEKVEPEADVSSLSSSDLPPPPEFGIEEKKEEDKKDKKKKWF